MSKIEWYVEVTVKPGVDVAAACREFSAMLFHGAHGESVDRVIADTPIGAIATGDKTAIAQDPSVLQEDAPGV